MDPERWAVPAARAAGSDGKVSPGKPREPGGGGAGAIGEGAIGGEGGGGGEFVGAMFSVKDLPPTIQIKVGLGGKGGEADGDAHAV